VYVSILDENDNWVCHLNFNKQYIESLGNRYDKDGMSNASWDPRSIASWELDANLNKILCKVQDKLGLAKSLDTSS